MKAKKKTNRNKNNKKSFFKINSKKNKKNKKEFNYFYITIIIFILIFTLRTYLSLKNPYFSNEDSYLHLRYAKEIGEKGFINYDPLSYGGRDIEFISLVDYFIGFLSLTKINIIIIAKILNELIASLFIILTYLISLEITKSKKISFLAALFSTSIPYLTKENFNVLNVNFIGIFGSFILLYLFLKINKKNNLIIHYTITLFLISLISPVSLIFTLSLLVFYFLALAYNYKITETEKELIFFSFFTNLIIEFFIFKNVLRTSGLNIIWQNIPDILINTRFPTVSLTYITYILGISSVLMFAKITYINLTKKRNRTFFIIFSLTLTTLILLWTHIISLNLGLTIISLILPIGISFFILHYNRKIKDTKFYNRKTLILVSFLITFILTNTIPTEYYLFHNKKIIDQEDINALNWLKNNIPENSTIFCDYNYGNLVNYYSNKRVIANTNFLGVNNINHIFQDINIIKNTLTKTNLIELLNKYNIDYVLLNKKVDKKSYDNPLFKDSCFELKYQNNKIKILKLKCKIE